MVIVDGSRRPLTCRLNREGIGAYVPSVCCVLESGFVELQQRFVFGLLHNARTRYDPPILRGKRQAPPDATLKTPVELMPQVDSIPATGHSEAACADETDTKLGAARTIAKAIAFDTRMKSPSLFQVLEDSVFRSLP